MSRSTVALVGLTCALLLALWYIGYIGNGALFDTLTAKVALAS